MKNKIKKIPRFKDEDEEREFWDTHDSTEYIDWSRAVKMSFPNLKPSTKTITLRVPAYLKDVPYQSLMKVYLADKIKEENCLSKSA